MELTPFEGAEMTHSRLIWIVLALIANPARAENGGALPTRVGACVVTTIEAVETRLVDGSTPIPNSGSAVRFSNGGYQVSYETVPAIEDSRKGDRVRMCFISTPLNCPPGDTRGKVYYTTNLRTRKSWKLPDSEHVCGGA
jgi:hypothetical protein